MKAKNQKIAAFLLCVIFFVTTFFGTLFILENSDHNCIGESCSVCRAINHFDELIHGSRTSDKPVFVSAITVYCIVTIMLYKSVDISKSLIKLKVKLSN